MTITDQSRALVLPELVEASEDRRRRRGRGGSGGAGRDQRMPLAVGTTGVLLLGALYCLLPVAWVRDRVDEGCLASCSRRSRSRPSTHLWDNIVELTHYRDGLYWRWMLNTALYAGVGALVSAYVSALSGYALAKYAFPGKERRVQRPARGRARARRDRSRSRSTCCSRRSASPNTYWSVLLPQLISPYGIYLARIYAAAAVPTDIIEAARTEGAGELRHLPPHRAADDGARAGDDLPVPVRRRLEQLHAAVHHARRRRAVPDHRRALTGC